MSKEKKLSDQGVVVTRKVRKRKRTRKPVILNVSKAESIMSSADGAEGTDSEWSAECKLEWIEKFQRGGVDAEGNPQQIYVHFDGVDTCNIATGEVIPRP
jgi:hypothetical protein